MRITESVLKYIVVFFSFFTVICLVAASIIGKSQDKVFASDTAQYAQMVIAVEKGDYKSALENSITLEERQYSSELYNYLTGLSATYAGETEKGIRHFQRTLDINPYMVEDSMFMLQFAEALLIAEMTREASVVLEKCNTLPTPENYPQYQERVTYLQEIIANQS